MPELKLQLHSIAFDFAEPARCIRDSERRIDEVERICAAARAGVRDCAGQSSCGSGNVVVTISGSGGVQVGTLLVGHLVTLGLTEAAPTAGITDYSKKVVDEFGAVTVVQRAWSKRMTANALIRTDAADTVFGRVAAVRAVPSLWIGQDGLDSLTVYGFFKDFSIEVGEEVSRLSLSIEGLSTAAKVAPLTVPATVDWPNVGDPDGTKPDDGATVGAPAGTYVGSILAEDIGSKLQQLEDSTATDLTPPGVPTGLTASSTIAADGTIDLTFSWTGNTESDLAYYVLQIKLSGGNYVAFNAPKNSYVFHGLQPNTPFTAQVAAFDKPPYSLGVGTVLLSKKYN